MMKKMTSGGIPAIGPRGTDWNKISVRYLRDVCGLSDRQRILYEDLYEAADRKDAGMTCEFRIRSWAARKRVDEKTVRKDLRALERNALIVRMGRTKNVARFRVVSPENLPAIGASAQRLSPHLSFSETLEIVVDLALANAKQGRKGPHLGPHFIALKNLVKRGLSEELVRMVAALGSDTELRTDIKQKESPLARCENSLRPLASVLSPLASPSENAVAAAESGLVGKVGLTASESRETALRGGERPQREPSEELAGWLGRVTFHWYPTFLFWSRRLIINTRSTQAPILNIAQKLDQFEDASETSPMSEELPARLRPLFGLRHDAANQVIEAILFGCIPDDEARAAALSQIMRNCRHWPVWVEKEGCGSGATKKERANALPKDTPANRFRAMLLWIDFYLGPNMGREIRFAFGRGHDPGKLIAFCVNWYLGKFPKKRAVGRPRGGVQAIENNRVSGILEGRVSEYLFKKTFGSSDPTPDQVAEIRKRFGSRFPAHAPAGSRLELAIVKSILEESESVSENQA